MRVIITYFIATIIFGFYTNSLFAQERIQMTLDKGVYHIPCEVNGLKLSFVFDTGASDVHISLIEAAFMLKNGYISEDDFIGRSNYIMADGSIAENTLINLKTIKIGNIIINNVTACVSSEINASLLLGQSAIKKLGKYAIEGNYLLLYNNSGHYKGDSILDNQYQLWLTLSKDYDIGAFEDFRIYLSYSDNRWNLYKEIIDEYDEIPNYESFSKKLGYRVDENDPRANLSNLYFTLLKEEYTPPAFVQFIDDMKDENNLRGVYSTLLKEGYNPPDFNQFKIDMGYNENSINRDSNYNNHDIPLSQNNYYIAQVSAQVGLKEGPGKNYNSLLQIPKGSAVLVFSVDESQQYRKVLYIDKNIFGYINKNYLKNLQKLKEDTSGNLQIETQTYESTASIRIENRTNKNTTIIIGDNTYSFSPHQIITITNINPGKYTIMASAPGVIPYVVVDNVKAGYEYSWVFFIETVRK